MSAAWWPRAGCLLAVAFSLASVPAADAAPLRLDAGFGEGGIARVRFGIVLDPADTRPLPPVRQSDGKLLVAAARYEFHGNAQILLARFTRRGRPDPTFGQGGRERLGLRWNFVPSAVRVLPDGRILVLGAAAHGPFFYPAPGQLALVRLMPDGSPDPTFGTNGFVTWNPPWRDRTVNLFVVAGAFVPHADGRMFAAGIVEEAIRVGDPPQWPYPRVRRVVFVRFSPDGSVDESFGRGGVVEGPDGTDFFGSLTALPDGRIVALTSRNEGSEISWWLHRFTADGAVDSAFGTDGSVRLESGDVGELVPARDGGLISLLQTGLQRILPSGQLDPRFGTACGRSGPRAGTTGGAATPDGGILATATRYLRTPPPGHHESFAIRYGSDGCAAGRPLGIRNVSAGPPVLQGRRTALVAATYGRAPGGFARGLALIRIRH